MEIKIKLSDNAYIPKRMTAGAVGYDLCACENVIIEQGQTKVVNTGVAFELPQNIELQVRPRSGLSVKYDVIQILGTVDFDYRGEVKVIIKNIGDVPFVIGAGEWIAQAVFNKVELPVLIEVNEIGETKRGSSGFGSTGKDTIIKNQASELEMLVRQVMKVD